VTLFSAPLRFVLALSLLLSVSAALHAQLPTDSNAWKSRCNLLQANSAKIVDGTAPATLVSATRGVPGYDYFVLAVNRAQAGQHYAACTMYYLAAIAEHAGNGGKTDTVASSNYAVVGGSEWKLAQHHHLRMHEHVVRVKLKVEELTGKPLSLTPPQTSAVLDAASTTPIAL
jgi:hypothetical protein